MRLCLHRMIIYLLIVCFRPVLSGSQSCNILLKAQRWADGQGSRETADFVCDRISDVLNNRAVGKGDPPPIDLCCSSVTEVKCRHVQKLIDTHLLVSAFETEMVFQGRDTICLHSWQPTQLCFRTYNQHAYTHPNHHPSAYLPALQSTIF